MIWHFATDRYVDLNEQLCSQDTVGNCVTHETSVADKNMVKNIIVVLVCSQLYSIDFDI